MGSQVRPTARNRQHAEVNRKGPRSTRQSRAANQGPSVAQYALLLCVAILGVTLVAVIWTATAASIATALSPLLTNMGLRGYPAARWASAQTLSGNPRPRAWAATVPETLDGPGRLLVILAMAACLGSIIWLLFRTVPSSDGTHSTST